MTKCKENISKKMLKLQSNKFTGRETPNNIKDINSSKYIKTCYIFHRYSHKLWLNGAFD